MLLCVCLSVTQGDGQLESDMKSLTEKKELPSGKVTAKVGELPWWKWVCHQRMGNGSGWTSTRPEWVHLPNQKFKAKLENKSTEVQQNLYNPYYENDNTGLFKSKKMEFTVLVMTTTTTILGQIFQFVILGWSASAVCVLSKRWGEGVSKFFNSYIRGLTVL